MATVLIVDDSAIDRRLAKGLLEKKPDLAFSFAVDGKDAFEQIKQAPPDVVVTDLQMPEMNGLELVCAVRANFPLVPVILMTAQGSEDIAVQALSSGAASYVPKSRLAVELLNTVETVLGAAHAQRHHARLMECLTRNQWNFVLDNDPSLVAAVIDHMQQHVTRLRLCDETGRIRLAIALEEALLNALYHGNLEISSELRENDMRAYYSLSDERRRSEPYRSRTVKVEATLSRDEAVYVIRDEGPGYDPSSLPDPTDPSNLEKVSGRGLLLIRTFMDEVRHNPKGNEITMIKRREP
ncbi:MAG TPA: response regulator [Pirellulales bacterium]|nr:response regulator [Pirellulales bacterium]